MELLRRSHLATSQKEDRRHSPVIVPIESYGKDLGPRGSKANPTNTHTSNGGVGQTGPTRLSAMSPHPPECILEWAPPTQTNTKKQDQDLPTNGFCFSMYSNVSERRIEHHFAFTEPSARQEVGNSTSQRALSFCHPLERRAKPHIERNVAAIEIKWIIRYPVLPEEFMMGVGVTWVFPLCANIVPSSLRRA